jgi:hypothetical protein
MSAWQAKVILKETAILQIIEVSTPTRILDHELIADGQRDCDELPVNPMLLPVAAILKVAELGIFGMLLPVGQSLRLL